MSHEGRMRRGREEKARGLDTADTRYFDQQVAAGKEKPDVTAEELKKKEKKSLVEKIKGIWNSKKSPEEKEKELEKVTEGK